MRDEHRDGAETFDAQRYNPTQAETPGIRGDLSVSAAMVTDSRCVLSQKDEADDRTA